MEIFPQGKGSGVAREIARAREVLRSAFQETTGKFRIMFQRIAHIGVAVKDLDDSVRLLATLFGKQPDHREDVPDQSVTTAMFRFGDSAVELLQATKPDSSVATFIDRRGEGVHHLSFMVDDIEQELARLKAEGFQLVDDHGRPGAEGCLVAFLHPRTTNGVLIELSQKIR